MSNGSLAIGVPVCVANAFTGAGSRQSCSRNSGDGAPIAVRRVLRGAPREGRPIVPYLILFVVFCLVGLLVTCAMLL